MGKQIKHQLIDIFTQNNILQLKLSIIIPNIFEKKYEIFAHCNTLFRGRGRNYV